MTSADVDDLTDERIAHIPTHHVDALCLEASQRSGGIWGRYAVLWTPGAATPFTIVSVARLLGPGDLRAWGQP